MKFLLVSLALAMTACTKLSIRDVIATGNTPVSIELTKEHRQTSDQIISVFENNTTHLQYGYSEVLGDGRGITAGRAGFTTATGDLHTVVSHYCNITTQSALCAYLPTLKKLKNDHDHSVEAIDGLATAWLAASTDYRFRETQDKIVDDYYYQPAVRQAKSLAVQYPLTLLALYDTAIQHGNGTDKDGLQAIITRTNKALGGSPADGIDEPTWLVEFLSIRKGVLRNPNNKATQRVWSESVGRVDTLLKLTKQENYLLTTPLVINPWGTEFVIR